jgi:TRAP-type C4-dicarboxylate transport system permease small subunit
VRTALSTLPETHIPITAEEITRTFDEEAGPPIDLRSYGSEDWATFALFWLMSLAVFLQFFTRYVMNDSLAWTEEIATYCLVAIVFLGSAMCVRIDRHIHVDFLFRYLPQAAARVLSTAIDLLRIVFFAYMAWLVWTFMGIVGDEEMTTIRVPKNLIYACVFAGFCLMFLRSLQVAAINWRRGYSVLERPEASDAPPVTEA